MRGVARAGSGLQSLGPGCCCLALPTALSGGHHLGAEWAGPALGGGRHLGRVGRTGPEHHLPPGHRVGRRGPEHRPPPGHRVGRTGPGHRPPPGHRVGRTGPGRWPQLAQQVGPSFHSQLSLTRRWCLICKGGFYLPLIPSFQAVMVWDPTRAKPTSGREGTPWAFRMSVLLGDQRVPPEKCFSLTFLL